jgi:hypothetical protein
MRFVALSKSGGRFLVRVIALAKKKTSGASSWPEPKGRFCNFFPASGWPSCDNAVLSLARKAKTLVVILGRWLFSLKATLLSPLFFLFVFSFFYFKQIEIRWKTI